LKVTSNKTEGAFKIAGCQLCYNWTSL
jgi:hypothetical protein